MPSRERVVDGTAYSPNNIKIGQRVFTPDHVSTADLALFNNRHDCATMIEDVQPIAYLQAVAVYRKLALFDRVYDHQRNQLFRKLPRSVIVAAIDDDRRKTVGALPGSHEMVRRRF